MRFEEFTAYHAEMQRLGDIDPAFPMLRYVCDRFELNLEQRYWLAWLFAMTYCGATVFYIYNEFPDYQGVDVDRMQRWWDANKTRCLFQTDRLRVKTQNQFVRAFKSYRGFARGNQHVALSRYFDVDEGVTYRRLYNRLGKLYYVGRFTLFLYTEALNVLADVRCRPDTLDWRNSMSSRNGLLFAAGSHELLRGHDYSREPFPKVAYRYVESEFQALRVNLREKGLEDNVWAVETTLCAFKKYKRGKRYAGYYLDRQRNEIKKMQSAVPKGVCWDVLWDYRAENLREESLTDEG